MSLELRKTSRFFYARFYVGSDRPAIKLKTEVQGTPPEGLRISGEGDAKFERSRGRALEEEAQLREELLKPQSKAKTLKRILEVQTGEKHEYVKVEALFELSKNSQRKRQWSSRYESDVKMIAERFVDYLDINYPNIKRAHEVRRIHAEAFLKAYLSEKQCSSSRINDVKSALQGLWTVAIKLDLITENPFKWIEKLDHLTLSKKPFSIAELESILEEAKKDPDLYAMCVLASSTGMRMGDCCQLKWSSIDWERRLVQVPSQKKNQNPTHVPFFGALEGLLHDAWKAREDPIYVFPRVKYLKEIDRNHFTKAFSLLLLRLGYTDDENSETSIRMKPEKGGLRRVPIRSFHGLRTTWMTNALNGGISMEDVQRVIGSVDAETIIKHYFNSNAERIRGLLQQNFPPALGGSQSIQSVKDEFKFSLERAMLDLEVGEQTRFAQELIQQLKCYVADPKSESA